MLIRISKPAACATRFTEFLIEQLFVVLETLTDGQISAASGQLDAAIEPGATMFVDLSGPSLPHLDEQTVRLVAGCVLFAVRVMLDPDTEQPESIVLRFGDGHNQRTVATWPNPHPDQMPADELQALLRTRLKAQSRGKLTIVKGALGTFQLIVADCVLQDLP